jgi:hypothetical protein
MTVRLLVVLVAGVLVAPQIARAADQTDEKVADIIGIVKGQTAVMTLVNVGDPNIIPPGPCLGSLTFLTADNQVLVSRSLSLEVGKATFALVNADSVPFRGRLLIRGLARFVRSPDPTVADPCTNTRLAVEVVDNRTLQTVVLAPEPHLVDPPEPERHFGFVGVTQSQKLQVNIYNTGDGSVVPDPCEATVHLIGLDGSELAPRMTLSVAPAAVRFASVDGNLLVSRGGRLEVRGLIEFPPPLDPTAPNPCATMRASIELFDAKSGMTSAFMGDPTN